MKLVTKYLADAAKFDQLAALEQDPQVREQEAGGSLPQIGRKKSNATWRATVKATGYEGTL